VYAGTFGLGAGFVGHLAFDTPFGPRAVLVMPDTAVSARREIEGERLAGVLLPLGGGWAGSPWLGRAWTGWPGWRPTCASE